MSIYFIWLPVIGNLLGHTKCPTKVTNGILPSANISSPQGPPITYCLLPIWYFVLKRRSEKHQAGKRSMHALWLQFEVEVLEASAHMCFSKLVCVPILCFVQKQQVFLLCFLASHISFFSVTHFQTTWELLDKIPEGICIFATGREIKFTIKISCVVCEGYRNRSVWWSTYQSKKNSATLVQRGGLSAGIS